MLIHVYVPPLCKSLNEAPINRLSNFGVFLGFEILTKSGETTAVTLRHVMAFVSMSVYPILFYGIAVIIACTVSGCTCHPSSRKVKGSALATVSGILKGF